MNRLYLIIIIGLISCNGKIDSKEKRTKSDNNDTEKIELELAKKQFLDTLNFVIGFDELSNITDKKENQNLELIRLFKSTFAFGMSEIIVVELENKKEEITLKEFQLEFKLNCNTPMYGYKDRQDFNRNCFKINRTQKRSINFDEYKVVQDLIKDTGFFYTAYNQKTRVLCDGHSYTIKYINPILWRNEIFSLERSCPSEKTAIYLIGEELIKLTKLD